MCRTKVLAHFLFFSFYRKFYILQLCFKMRWIEASVESLFTDEINNLRPKDVYVPCTGWCVSTVKETLLYY